MQTTSLLGVLAFGDSITNGGGELQWGVALQSWAMWTARALGLPYTGCATDGARARDVVETQIPALACSSANPEARYDLGCLYIGVNDVRSFDWDPGEFASDFAAALAFLTARCERTLALTAPLDLGRPRAGAKVHELNAAIARLADVHGTLVVDLADFGARNHVMVDHVHPTAFGQIAIAQRALAVLAGDGMTVREDPAGMIRFQTTWWKRLRGDLTYAYRHTKVTGRTLFLQAAHLRSRAP